MSKIEQILERATLLREASSVAEERKQQPEETVHQAGPAPDQSVFRATHEMKVANPYLVMVSEPDSPVREEYLKLKSVVVKLTKSQKFLNTVAVTSSLSGEGKSITALNLAIAMAQEFDHTVLLVDGDLRRPSIGSYLGVGLSGLGLSDCLLHGADMGEALVKTGIGKLSILPAGKQIPNPVELFSSNKMRDFVAELKSRYSDRYIIFDTPPLLLFAESRVLASMSDAVLFVVREGQVPLQQVKEALNMLKGDNVLGVVYNDVKTSKHRKYSYYSSYSYPKSRIPK